MFWPRHRGQIRTPREGRRSLVAERAVRPLAIVVLPPGLHELLRVDPVEWLPEIDPIREFYDELGNRLPGELPAQLDALQERLNRAQS